MTPNSKYEFLKVTWKNFRKKICFDFFDRLKRKLGKHWRESWLTSTQYFEVLGVKLTQTLFLNIILRKILRKKSKKLKIFENFFVVIWVVLCVQNISNWFGAFLWHNNCRKCRNRDTLNSYSDYLLTKLSILDRNWYLSLQISQKSQTYFFFEKNQNSEKI